MDTDEQILDFLSAKENLSFALEISKRTGQIRERIHRKFWELAVQCTNQFADDLPDFSNNWRIQYNPNSLFANWHSISLVPRSPTSKL